MKTFPLIVFLALAFGCGSICGQLLEIGGIHAGETSVSVDVNSDPGLYVVLDRLDLESGSVIEVVDMADGVAGASQLVDTNPPPNRGFYQVRGFDQEHPEDLDQDGIDDLFELQREGLNPLDPADASNSRPFDGTTTTELDAYLNNYEIGRGRFDITGVAADGNMMGYAEGSQTTKGIHDRQWARAFIVRDRLPPHRRVVYVVVDNGQTFQSVTKGVHDKIREDDMLKEHYSYENIIMSATHTHGASAGHSHWALFHITGGYSWRVYDAMVHGIYMAIKNAHRDLEPGSIERNRGQLLNANENRRPKAFLQNVEHTNPALFNPYDQDGDGPDPDNRDTEMFALRFEHEDSGPVAMFNWFAVHGVSVSKFNQLLTGDNKGNAAYLFEKANGAVYPGYNSFRSDQSTFVAGFSNSNPGDMTANRRSLESPWPEPPEAPFLGIGWPGEYDQAGKYGRADDYERATRIGERQFNKATDLFEGRDGQPTKVTGSIDYRHQYVDFSAIDVDPETLYPYNVPEVSFPGSSTAPPWTTCHGAYGVEFAGGTLDGEALSQTLVDALIGLFPNVNGDPFVFCQQPKDILFKTTGDNGGLMGNWLPVSILKVGDVAILGVSAEFTVMAGYRLRKTVEETFAAEGQNVRAVIAGLSNAYSGYVTTYEEYIFEEGEAPFKNQGYEAASTHFGAFTLCAYQAKFTDLARDIATGSNAPADSNTVSMPGHVQPDIPFVDPLARLPVADIAPLPGAVAATYHEDAGCPTGQLHDLLSGDCFSCPIGYNRRLLLPITDAEVCEKPPFSEFDNATEHGDAGCPAGQFFDLLTGDCWSCPAGYNRTVLPVTGNSACERPAFSSFSSATEHNGAGCPAGQFFDLLTGDCWSCPSGYNRTIFSITGGSACERPAFSNFSGADSTAVRSICPSGYVHDVFLNRCYRCPSGYSKVVLAAWNASNACQTGGIFGSTRSALSQAVTSPCPSGYTRDLLLNRCYKCPSGYNKVILHAWNASNACQKVTPADFDPATRHGDAGCPVGQFFDIGHGTCWSCPGGYKRTIFPVTASNACEKVTPAVFDPATRHGDGGCPAGQFLDIGHGSCWSCPGEYKRTIFPVTSSIACEKVNPAVFAAAEIFGKAACEARNSSWFLDIGRNECWSCPTGSIRNLNPVNGGEACTKFLTFGDIRTQPNDSYARGSTASVSFWAGHPKNVFGNFDSDLTNGVGTFFRIQWKNGSGVWETVRTDADWDTVFEWTPQFLSGACTVIWHIPVDAKTGEYRVIHDGYHSDDTPDGVSRYTSKTPPTFQVTN